MTIIYSHNNITVKKHDTALGVEYRVSDGVYEFSLSECPELEEYKLKCLIEDYMRLRFDDLLADCEERETHHFQDDL